MKTAPHGFGNFSTLSLQDILCDAMIDGIAGPSGSCSSISSQLCARLWRRNMRPETRRLHSEQLHPLPCRHTRVPSASRWLLPSPPVPKPTITGGSAHPAAGRSLRNVPWVRLHPCCLPPVPPSHSSPVGCRDPTALPPVLVHATRPMSPLSLPRGDQLFARSGKPGPGLPKDGRSQRNIKSRIRPATPSSSLLSAPKFSLDFHAAHLSYQPPLLSLDFS